VVTAMHEAMMLQRRVAAVARGPIGWDAQVSRPGQACRLDMRTSDSSVWVIRDSPSLSGSGKRVDNCLCGRARADAIDSGAELAAQSYLIGICVATDDDVLQVVDSLRGGLRPGSIVASHSTVLPETCRRVQETLGRPRRRS
jgi:hypothetical protein